MNLKPPRALTEEKHLKRFLGVAGAILAAVGFFGFQALGGCGKGGSDAPVVEINNLPLDVIIERPCDSDGCQLWWQWNDATRTWLPHAGSRAAAVQAIADGAMYVKVPTVG